MYYKCLDGEKYSELFVSIIEKVNEKINKWNFNDIESTVITLKIQHGVLGKNYIRA